jgi:hypothetical protein
MSLWRKEKKRWSEMADKITAFKLPIKTKVNWFELRKCNLIISWFAMTYRNVFTI